MCPWLCVFPLSLSYPSLFFSLYGKTNVICLHGDLNLYCAAKCTLYISFSPYFWWTRAFGAPLFLKTGPKFENFGAHIPLIVYLLWRLNMTIGGWPNLWNTLRSLYKSIMSFIFIIHHLLSQEFILHPQHWAPRWHLIPPYPFSVL